MSERFVRYSPKEDLEEQFEVTSPRSDYFEPDYNISPGNRMPVIYFEDGARKLYDFRWGMIPEQADSEKEGDPHFITAVEQLSEEPYQTHLQQRRCIIPADGFYKWKTGDKKSTPFYIRLLSNRMMGLAGIYTVWESDSGRSVFSFSMLTTEANALIQPVDSRMPVILDTGNYAAWLGEEAAEIEPDSSLFTPYDMTRLAVNRVTEEVNDPDNNRPELIQPIPK